MSANRAFVAENDTQRARLKNLVSRLSDAELARAMSDGWTVAGVLGHLAFWDQRILVLLAQWERSPATPPPGHIAADVDWINDAAKPMLLALAPRRAAELAVAIAEAVDRKVASLPDELLKRNEDAGTPLSPLRAQHRREHLDEIERLLGT